MHVAFKQILVKVIYEPYLDVNEINSLRAKCDWIFGLFERKEEAWPRFVPKGNGIYCLDWLSRKEESDYNMFYARMIINNAQTVQFNIIISICVNKSIVSNTGVSTRKEPISEVIQIPALRYNLTACEVNIILLSLHVRYKMKTDLSTCAFACTEGDVWNSVLTHFENYSNSKFNNEALLLKIAAVCWQTKFKIRDLN